LICFAIRIASAQPPAAGAHPDLMTLEQARVYMLGLINRDRASKNLRPLEMDAVASRAGQKHAEEMASYAFLSHHNREGKLPDQRYTEAGGTGLVQENVYLATYGAVTATEPRPSAATQVFKKADIEYIQAAYFNQIPPNDYHRRNILDARHTHVGIGFALAGEGRGVTLANAQEFVARYVEVEPIPTQAAAGAVIAVKGRVPENLEFYSVEVSREDLPQPRELSDLRKSGPYRTPGSFTSYYPDHQEKSNRARLGAGGSFEAAVRLSDDNRPGLYYVRIRLRDKNGEKFWASQRTVIVQPEVPKVSGNPS
jgi:uncharacterized protein YkwD